MNGTTATRLRRLERIRGGGGCPCQTDPRRLVRFVPADEMPALRERLADEGHPVEHCEGCGRRLPTDLYLYISVDPSRV